MALQLKQKTTIFGATKSVVVTTASTLVQTADLVSTNISTVAKLSIENDAEVHCDIVDNLGALAGWDEATIQATKHTVVSKALDRIAGN